MVYEPDRFLAVGVTVLIGIVALLAVYTILFFALVGVLRLCARLAQLYSGAFRRRPLSAGRRGSA